MLKRKKKKKGASCAIIYKKGLMSSTLLHLDKKYRVPKLSHHFTKHHMVALKAHKSARGTLFRNVQSSTNKNTNYTAIFENMYCS